MKTTHASVDEWVDVDNYEPPACEPLITIGERLQPVTRALAATPGATAITTLGVAALIVGGFALRPVSAVGSDSHGPFVAHCGVSYYLFGHPNPVIQQTCSAAYAGHATVVLAAAVVLAALAAVAIAAATRRTQRHRFANAIVRTISATRVGALLACIALTALVVGASALRTVPIRLTDQVGPLTAHCGLGYQLLGTDNSVVQTACRRAFSSHADLALACAVVLAVAVTSIVIRTRTYLRRCVVIPETTEHPRGPA